mmetsp:Transcript_19393/g.31203  ORF Transcript_19393/g.31203 Transcript_19393/m.31203 type:complete len:102 (+) Transcript_19393:895-1200(+)
MMICLCLHIVLAHSALSIRLPALTLARNGDEDRLRLTEVRRKESRKSRAPTTLLKIWIEFLFPYTYSIPPGHVKEQVTFGVKIFVIATHQWEIGKGKFIRT